MNNHVKMLLLDAYNKYDTRVRNMKEEIKTLEEELAASRRGLQEITQMRDDVKEELDKYQVEIGN